MNRKTIVYLSLIALAALVCLEAHAQTFSVIHAFTGVEGAEPQAGLTLRAGVLYGTTTVCLQHCTGAGTVYQMTPVGSNWYFTPISFLQAGGRFPSARVVFGPDHHLYGTTNVGGSQNMGVVFNLTPPASICKIANCLSTETVLHQFTGSPDGGYPGYGDLVWDSTGNIYGTTELGGTSSTGTVYQMTKSGDNWTETPIYSFTGADGLYPWAGVMLDSNGNLFGTTYGGGLYGYGSVFELTYSGTGWTETVLHHNFHGNDGSYLFAGLVRDSAGNLYGATIDDGISGGTVFELSPVGDAWVFTLLYSWVGRPGLGCGPQASLTLDAAGNLYGTTYCDGANLLGNVFKLTKTQNGWEYTLSLLTTSLEAAMGPVPSVM